MYHSEPLSMSEGIADKLARCRASLAWPFAIPAPQARLRAGGNGTRTVSSSPVRVGLFAACGKFAAWLDLFMTPWWREVDSNHRSPSRDCRRSERFAQRS